MKTLNWENIRSQYAVFSDRIYLRTNGGGPLSDKYIEAYTKGLQDASTKSVFGKNIQSILRLQENL